MAMQFNPAADLMLPNWQNCASVLQKLHEIHHKLRDKYPIEFKNSLRSPSQGEEGAGHPPEEGPQAGWGAVPQQLGRTIASEMAAAENKRTAVDEMADEDAGWSLIAKLQWAHADDYKIDQSKLKRTLTALRKRDEIPRLLYWMDQLSERARTAVPSLKKQDKNSLYQLVAMGKMLYEAALKAPDVLDFTLHQLQQIDLAAALTSK